MKSQDSIRRINEEIAKIKTPAMDSELAPLVEAVRLIARHLDETGAGEQAPKADDYYLKHEAPEYSGK